ncbi:phosphate/phosphite/phosphonate ABC transporter substrate-binding protein [Effusibacillus lacus]|uniref:Phosphonate-binding protein n=1 Tax=Effusibacillus lacus TaxID=1348429 RepID=A0A292YS22_9BACL|nr:phosphate/phosphite/phosphonate ABC transporter substrate-binding protein [Effusibacillus lacus]TCS76881.1 phosphonate transport system substrate-binding protein [Effusibacillus lacus]GAX91214.1 phosphonate-binding protein [Effusibacillus lacus]
MLKKAVMAGLTMVLAAGLLAGCGGGKNQTAPNQGQGGGSAAKGYVPKELKVQFVPSQNAETLEAKAKPLEKLLGDKLGIPVKVSVSTTYNTIIEAMASKQVDVGFLPPTAYVLAKEKGAAEVILQAQRLGVNPDGSSSSDLVDFYRAMVVVKAGSPIKELKDLKGKKVAVQDVTSSAGYVWPAVELKKAGVDPEKDIQAVKVKGHDKGILAVLNGDADAAFVFEDARNTVKKDKPDVFEKVSVLHRTDKIPNDTISVRSDMDKEWISKIQKAFIEIGKDPAGKGIIKDIYTHEGYVESSDKNFDIVREYSKQVGK